MKRLKVLDVTLRDGGCVNNFDFGQEYMDKILYAQEESGVDIIEVGYIDEKEGSAIGRTKFIDEQVISKYFLHKKSKSTSYVAMIDYGKFDVNKLKRRTAQSIDGIRLAFHKCACEEVIKIGREILEKGYDLYIQPMITLRYSDEELLRLIDVVNKQLSDATAFYIVDSFGEMRPNDMERILNLVDHNLDSKMQLGLHSHNNLQMSYSNAIALLQFPTNRNIIIDSSIMGMGKGAGNLNTELLLEHMNLFYGKNYIIEPLLEVMDKVLNQIHAEFYWGYAPEYYLSSANHCTPSYASYFYNKHMLPIDQVGELLGMIDDDKKISFDKEYAEALYRKYNENKAVDDSGVVTELQNVFLNEEILLVAPGKSVLESFDIIKEIALKNTVISIGLNTDFDFLNYILTTRSEMYEKVISDGRDVIVCSNISKGGRGRVRILNYKNWIEIDERTHDSSLVIALNLLKVCKVKKILLAGFDGFDLNINENYYDKNMRQPITIEQVKKRNKYYKAFINKIKDTGVKIEFVTHSLYE